MDGLAAAGRAQQLPWPLALLLLVLGGSAGSWAHFAGRVAASPIVRAASPIVRAAAVEGFEGLARATSAAAIMGAPQMGAWATLGAGVAAGFFLASLAACACACGGSCLGAVCYWAQGRSREATTCADLDALAGQIYAGGRQGRALRAASQRLRAMDDDVWYWAVRRSREQMPSVGLEEPRR
jgi:hypothetical protein